MSPPKSEPLTLPKGWTVETPAPSQPLMLPEGFTVEPQTLREAWKSAEKDPVRRTELVKDIAKAYAEQAYGARDDDNRPLGSAGQAFSDTGQNLLGFGMKRRDIRKTGQRTFGMTDDEARLLADEVDRLKMEMQPGATFAGGLTGIVGGGGLAGRGVQALARAPSVFGQIGRAIMTQAGQPAANIVRGAGAGLGTLAATEALGQERLPDPVAAAAATVGGGFIPGGAQAAGNYASRFFGPRAEAARIIGRDVGPAGAQRAEEFAQATGETIPVGSAVLNPAQAPAVARSMPILEDAGVQLERATEAMNDALVQGMRRNVGQRVPGGDTPLSPKQLKGAATAFSNAFLGPVRDIPISLKQNEMFDLSDIFDKLSREPQVPDSNLMRVKAEQFRLGNITVKQAEDARMLIKEWSKRTAGGFETYQPYIDTLVGALDREVPGFRADYLGRHEELMNAADNAKRGMKITTKDLPQGFGAEVRRGGVVDPAAEMGIGYGVLRELGETPEEALAFARKYGRPGMSPAGRLEEGLGQRGQEISAAAREYGRASEGVSRLRTATPAAVRGPTGTEVSLAVLQPGLYFATRVAARIVQGLTLPPNVRTQVMELMTDPTRVDDAIAAMRAGGVRDDVINQFVRNYRTQISGATGAGAGGMVTGETEPDVVEQMMAPVARAVSDLQGQQMTRAQMDAAEDRLAQLTQEGLSPEQAIDTYLREIRP